MTRVGTSLLLSLVLAAAAFAEKPRVHGFVVDDVRTWAGHVAPMDSRRSPSAVAVSVDDQGHGAVGIATGYGNLDRARVVALERCAEMAELREREAPCEIYSLGSQILFDFSDHQKAGASVSLEQCLERPDVKFYILNAWMRVFRAAGFSYKASIDLEYELELGPAGSLRSLELVRNDAPESEAAAGKAFWSAAPFGPLFGSLSCLAGRPFRFPLDSAKESGDGTAPGSLRPL